MGLYFKVFVIKFMFLMVLMMGDDTMVSKYTNLSRKFVIRYWFVIGNFIFKIK